MTKAKLRNLLRQNRQRKNLEEVQLTSIDIAIRCLEIMNAVDGAVHVYSSQKEWQEVDTSFLTSEIALRFPAVRIDTSLKTPDADIPLQMYQYIIVPLLGFDAACNRIGMGAGWYDRFLKDKPGAITIGLAFESQKVPRIPVESHDVALDIIITEVTMYRRGADVTI